MACKEYLTFQFLEDSDPMLAKSVIQILLNLAYIINILMHVFKLWQLY